MSRTAINVSGDLVAAKLMNCWVGGRTSAREQVAAEAEREEIRRATDQVVISGEVGVNDERGQCRGRAARRFPRPTLRDTIVVERRVSGVSPQ